MRSVCVSSSKRRGTPAIAWIVAGIAAGTAGLAGCGGAGTGAAGDTTGASATSGAEDLSTSTGAAPTTSAGEAATTSAAATSGAADTGGEGADTTGEAPAGSRCATTPTTLDCPKHTLELEGREVHYQVPLGEPPAEGWPVALMFQGSFVSAELTWSASEGQAFGAFHQTHVVKRLLDDGFAVVTPETRLDGSTYWDTNIAPYASNWTLAPDHKLMLAIFVAIADGAFGPLDDQRLVATGVSSGGYMTSRMAVSYPGKFRALAVAAGSYATCGGLLCVVPELAPDHPPTLLLHGALDPAVPQSTAEAYRDALLAAGVDTRLVVDPAVGHAWIPAAPAEVGAWFADHP